MRIVPMLLLLLAGCGGAVPAVAPPRVACGPAPAGLAPLVAPGAFTIFGELHGSEEIPAFVGAALCHAAEGGGPVVLGLEIPARDQPAVDAYLASDGGAAARAALLAGEHWASQDGRASRAMLGLVERARALRQAGRPVRVFLFDGVYADGAARDGGMAAALAGAVRAAPGATVLVLTGNLHARIDDARWMAAKLAPSFPALVSLDVAYEPGSVFGCSPEGCGIARVKGRAAGGPVPRVERVATGPYRGTFHVGALSPSPPATWPAGQPLPAQPRPLRAQAAEAYGRKDYAACVRLFDASAAKMRAMPEALANDLYGAACCHALAGELDAAFASLNQAIAAGFRDAAHMQEDPDLVSLRGDSRWPGVFTAAKAPR